MKKVLIFLLCCAVGYACWNTFFNTDSAEPTQEVVVEDTLDVTISVKKELKEIQNDSVALGDTLISESENVNKL